MSENQVIQGRVEGLDAIRAVLAIWVVMNHVAAPPLAAGVDTTNTAGWVVKSAYGLAINGQAAVIGFFVISGFCIHYPNRTRPITNPLSFYLRRLVRVGGPFAIVLAATQFLPSPWRELEQGIFWSVYSELVYYALYPVAAWLARRVGWMWLVIVSFILAPVVLLAPHPGGNYHAVGDGLAWALGLPCWLLGCRLAERYKQVKYRPSHMKAWVWRGIVWLASVLCYYLRFHTSIKHYHTLNLFAILIYGWLAYELCYLTVYHPLRWLERIGSWSYSLYLVHFFGAYLVSFLPLEQLGYILNWVVRCFVIGGTARLFGFLVEAPFHRFAKFLSARVCTTRSVMVVAAPQCSTEVLETRSTS